MHDIVSIAAIALKFAGSHVPVPRIYRRPSWRSWARPSMCGSSLRARAGGCLRRLWGGALLPISASVMYAPTLPRMSTRPYRVESQRLCLTSLNVLLIRKNKQQRILHLPILYYARELRSRLVHPLAVARVDHEDQPLRPGEVVPPQRPDLVLPAHVPHVELCVLVGHRLDVEADGGDRGYFLVELELVEDCCVRTRKSASRAFLKLNRTGGWVAACMEWKRRTHLSFPRRPTRALTVAFPSARRPGSSSWRCCRPS